MKEFLTFYFLIPSREFCTHLTSVLRTPSQNLQWTSWYIIHRVSRKNSGGYFTCLWSRLFINKRAQSYIVGLDCMLLHKSIAPTQLVTYPPRNGRILCLFAKPGGFCDIISPWRISNIHSSRESIWGWETFVSEVKCTEVSKTLKILEGMNCAMCAPC